MKHVTFCLFSLTLGLTTPILAQRNSLAINYDDVSVGRNFNLVYGRALSDKWMAYAGLKYHLNSPHFKNDINTYTLYFKESEAHGAGQRFGAKAGLQFMLYQSHCSFFTFWDIQYTRANITSKELGFALDSYFIYQHTQTDIVHSIENTFGLGARFSISPILNFSLKAGFGMNYYHSANRSIQSSSTDRWKLFPLPVSRIISAGIEYNLDKTKTSVKGKDLMDKSSLSFVQVAYNNVQVGRNYSLTYHYNVALNTHVYGGVKFHLNSKAFVDYSRMSESYYFKQFRTENLGQSIGIRAGAEQTFPIRGIRARLFGFYDFQLTHATIRNFAYISMYHSGHLRTLLMSLSQSKELEQLIYYRFCKPATAFENTIGLGARFPVSEKIQFRIQGGIGYNFYKRPENYETYTIVYPSSTKPGPEVVEYKNVKFDAPRSEFSKMFSIGLEYSLDGR